MYLCTKQFCDYHIFTSLNDRNPTFDKYITLHICVEKTQTARKKKLKKDWLTVYYIKNILESVDGNMKGVSG